ncbi:MAG TPA: fibronectin type III domain-containing protein, partial [Patescibacteria group bacterium]|nr:fibronectin type III domain-containing protein [Patescibacteria group bacterium]
AQSTATIATTQTPIIAPTISQFNASPSTIANGGSSTLSWTVSGNPAPALRIAPGIGAVSGTSLVVQPATTTTYTLSASNIAGTASAQILVTVNDTLPPSVPTNLTAVAMSTSQINVAWSNSIDNISVTGYRVFRNGSLIATPSTNSFADTGLTSSTTYSYTVAAFDAAGNVSPQSAPASATTMAQPVVPTLVQVSSNIADTLSTTIVQSFASPNSASNLIVVVTSWGSLTANPTVTDTAGNTYTLATSNYSSKGDQSLAIHYAKNIHAGPNTVTVNFGGSHDFRRILIAEYRGLDPLNPVDVMGKNQGNANTGKDSVSSGTVVTTSSGDLIFGAVENYNVNGTVSAGTGFTMRDFVMDKGVIETAFEDRIATSAGSVAATFTFSHPDGYIAEVVAFRKAPGP